MSQSRQRAIRTALISTVALLPLLSAGAAAASSSGEALLRLPIGAQKSYSTTLQTATNEREMRTLDWRTPSVDLRFNLSKADHIEKLSVTISADPLPGVDPSTPLMVQFNNGTPTKVSTRGQGFDATIRLDESRVRATGNVLTLSYASDCDPDRGGFALNLDRSRIDLTARAKTRRLQLGELEQRFAGSAFAPDTVGVIASGPDATALQALGAQAMGLRSDTVPNFRTSLSGTDFDLVMVPRSELYKYTNDAELLSRSGAGIEIGRDHPDRLFLTGDTPAQVRKSVEAFSSAYLPRSMRSFTSPGEIGVQSPLDYARINVAGTERLDRLSVSAGSLREYVFDVADPDAMSGDLVLRLTRDSQTEPGARMSAVLNGESLGEATLDGRRKTVSYPIRPGQLVGAQNRLELTTKASPDATPACGAAKPFIAIGAGSKLRLNAQRPSPASDLSRLAANGSVFGEGFGENTQVVLPVGGADFNASLSVVARLAKATGRGWIEAEFARGDAPAGSRHQLVIEPFAQIEDRLRDQAPRALLAAWRGTPTDGDNRLASVERFASLDTDEAVRMAARSLRASGSVRAGGVAAVFPGDDGRLVGLISNTPGSRFTTSVTQLASDAHWNGLSGGVARWNDRTVVMAQTSIDVPSLAQPEIAAPGLGERFASLELGGLTDRLALPTFDMSDIDMPSVDLAAMKTSASDLIAATQARFAKPSPLDGAITYPAPDYATAPVEGTAPIAVTPEPIATKPVQTAELKARIPVPTLAPRRADTASAPTLRGAIDLTSAQAKSGLIDSSALSVKGAQAWVKTQSRAFMRKAKRIRSEVRSNVPRVSGPKFQGKEIPVTALLLILAFIATVIGLGLTSPSHRHGTNH